MQRAWLGIWTRILLATSGGDEGMVIPVNPGFFREQCWFRSLRHLRAHVKEMWAV